MPTTIPPIGFVVVLLQVGTLAVILLLASLWLIFTAVGERGWLALVPVYNAFLLMEIAGKPGWWLLLLLVPFVNIYVAWKVCAALARKFGRSPGFAAGLLFLPFIFLPVLADGAAASAAGVRESPADDDARGRRRTVIAAILSGYFVTVTYALFTSLSDSVTAAPAPVMGLGATEGVSIAVLAGLIALSRWHRGHDGTSAAGQAP